MQSHLSSVPTSSVPTLDLDSVPDPGPPDDAVEGPLARTLKALRWTAVTAATVSAVTLFGTALSVVFAVAAVVVGIIALAVVACAAVVVAVGLAVFAVGLVALAVVAVALGSVAGAVWLTLATGRLIGRGFRSLGPMLRPRRDLVHG